MKIEMGESLFYSWLRHVKECQIVQTNWKVSPQWQLQDKEKLEYLKQVTENFFLEKYGYNIFKKNSSLSQILMQGECDVVGIAIGDNGINTYAVDVAFHEGGLNYGTRDETVMKVIAKSIRTAMCLHGFMNAKNAEIVFASPKINPAVMNDITPCIDDLNNLLEKEGLNYSVRVIANEEFNSKVLIPILMLSKGIADTSELFIRSYQMYMMFGDPRDGELKKSYSSVKKNERIDTLDPEYKDAYKELKIGKIAQIVLRDILERGLVSDEEVELMLTAEYSKKTFDLNYPLLAEVEGEYDRVRYYTNPLTIRGNDYVMCSQWFETTANNDRPYLIAWIEKHKEYEE